MKNDAVETVQDWVAEAEARHPRDIVQIHCRLGSTEYGGIVYGRQLYVGEGNETAAAETNSHVDRFQTIMYTRRVCGSTFSCLMDSRLSPTYRHGFTQEWNKTSFVFIEFIVCNWHRMRRRTSVSSSSLLRPGMYVHKSSVESTELFSYIFEFQAQWLDLL